MHNMHTTKQVLLGFITLCVFLLMGDVFGILIYFLIPYPLPAAIWGLFLFFCFCVLHGRVPAYIRPCAELLLRYMPVFFIPAGVSLLGFGDLLRQHGLVIFLVLFVSTALALAMTAHILQRLLNATEDDAPGEDAR